MTGTAGPIFIGGLSKSGKTQLRIVLAAHPDLSFTRRTYLWDRFYGRFGDLTKPANLERCLQMLAADDHVGQLQPDLVRLRAELRDGRITYARVFGLLHRHHAERAGKRRWGDQLGGVERYAEPIFAEFPNASMIHLLREVPAPGTRPPWTREIAMDRVRRWCSARLADRNRRRYRSRYQVVRYETLVNDPVGTISELCGFLGEDFLPSMATALETLRWDPIGGGGAPTPRRRPERGQVRG
jgi:hypothetical protein